MSARTRNDQREVATRRRRKPSRGGNVHFPFEGVDLRHLDVARPPADIHLEPTGSAGETAAWLDDFFWLELIQRWPQATLALHFRPTKNSLLHPVILHQLNMLRRVMPEWRLIGYCYLSDLAGEGYLEQAALTAHHEIHVIDTDRPGVSRTAHPLRIEEALAKMRRIQAANNRTTPLLVRCRPEGGAGERDQTSAEKSAPRGRTIEAIL